MKKSLMCEDFTLCYKAIQKFLNDTGHAQIASTIVIERLTFSREYEKATIQLLSDLSSLIPSNIFLRNSESDKNIKFFAQACFKNSNFSSFMESNSSSSCVDFDFPFLKNRFLKRPANVNQMASHHKSAKFMQLDINLEALQKKVTKDTVSFFSNKCLFFQMELSPEKYLMDKIKKFALIVNSVDDELDLCNVLEGNSTKKLDGFVLFNEYNNQKDDTKSQKSDNRVLVDRKDERHEEEGSPVFGCLSDESNNTESNNKEMDMIQQSDDTILHENFNSDSFSFSKLVEKEKLNSNETKLKNSNHLNEDFRNDELRESKNNYIKSLRQDVFHFDIRAYCQYNRSEHLDCTLYSFEDQKVIAERYLIKKLLFEEFSVCVMECYDKCCNQNVCIKVTVPDMVANIRFLNEVKILYILQHHKDQNESYCVKLHDFFYYKGRYFIVQELLKYTLYKAIVLSVQIDTFKLTLGKIQRIAYQVLRGLEKLHSLNILHCDLKPENILVETENPYKVKIIDFGNSLFANDKHMDDIIQTIYYRAPEVVLKLPFDSKIDIWSLGCILAELWLGYPLFRCDNASSLLIHMIATLGPFPFQMIKHSKLLSQFYFEKLLNLKKNTRKESQPLLHKVHVFKPSNFPLKDIIGTQAPDFLDFLTLLLQLQPFERPNAREALKHVWLRPGLYPDGL